MFPDLRAYIERLETEARLDDLFAVRLYEDLERRRRAALSPWRRIRLVAAPLAAAAVIAGVVVAIAVVRPQLGDAAASPSVSEVAVASPTPSPTLGPTPSATSTASLPTPSPTPSPGPTLPPPPTPTPRPFSTPTPDTTLSGTWTERAPAPRVDALRIGSVTSGPDEPIYALAEHEGGSLLAYDAAGDRWSHLPSSGGMAGEGTTAVLLRGSDRFVYLYQQGFGYANVYRYDPATNEWAHDPIARMEGEFGYEATVGSDGLIYFWAGDEQADFGEYTQLGALDPASGAMTRTATIDGTYHEAIQAGPGGRIYSFGFDGLASYDPRTDTWRVEDTGLRAIDHPYFYDMASDGVSLLYLVTVYYFNDPSVATFMAWDAGAEQWREISPMEPPVEFGGVFVGADGRLHVLESRLGDNVPRRVMVFTPDR